QWCIYADVAGLVSNLVRPHQTEIVLLALVVFDSYPCAEIGLAGVRRWTVHHGQQLQPLAQVSHASVDLAQPLLAVDVLSILGTIAQSGRIADLLGHPGTLLSPQIIELFPQALFAGGSNVIGNFASLLGFKAQPQLAAGGIVDELVRSRRCTQ